MSSPESILFSWSVPCSERWDETERGYASPVDKELIEDG